MQVLNLIAENEQFRKQTNQIQQQDKTRVLYEDQFTSQHQELLNQLDRLTGELNHLYSQLNLIQGRQVSLFSLARGIWDRVISDFLLDKEAVIDALSDLLEDGTDSEKMVAKKFVENLDELKNRIPDKSIASMRDTLSKLKTENDLRIQKGLSPLPITTERLAASFLEDTLNQAKASCKDVLGLGDEYSQDCENILKAVLPNANDLVAATDPKVCEEMNKCNQEYLSIHDKIHSKSSQLLEIRSGLLSENHHFKTISHKKYSSAYKENLRSINETSETTQVLSSLLRPK